MRVFMPSNIPGKCRSMLESYGIKVVVENKNRNLTSEELKENIKKSDAVITLLGNKIDKEIIDSSENLKIIANYAVGYNNIDWEYCEKKGIYVTNTPGVLTNATADLGFALMMSVARKIPQAHDYTKKGLFKGWGSELFLGTEIYGKRLGIIGFGRIGQAIAKRAMGFDMDIFYYSRSRKKEETIYNAKYSEPLQIASQCDFIILCCPLNDDSYHLVNKEFLDNMKKSAFIINIARGAVVDEPLLVEYLKNKRISGAGFDVYEKEPELTTGMNELDNVVILPHIGSASYYARHSMGEMCAKSVIDVLINKKKPELCVF